MDEIWELENDQIESLSSPTMVCVGGGGGGGDILFLVQIPLA